MADSRPAAPQPSSVVPPVSLPAPPTHLIVPPAQAITPPIQPIQPAPMPQLNWSHFKPEFASKPKMWKHIFLGPMTRWTPMLSQKVFKSRDSV